jgi:hypothetical protein
VHRSAFLQQQPHYKHAADGTDTELHEAKARIATRTRERKQTKGRTHRPQTCDNGKRI